MQRFLGKTLRWLSSTCSGHLIMLQRGVVGQEAPSMEETALQLISFWRRTGKRVVHVHHASLEEGSLLAAGTPGYAVKEGFEPIDGELVYVKHANSAFVGTTLEVDLRARGIGELVILGMTTHHCVSTTTRFASNLGFTCWVVGDACAVFDRAKVMHGPSDRNVIIMRIVYGPLKSCMQ